MVYAFMELSVRQHETGTIAIVSGMKPLRAKMEKCKVLGKHVAKFPLTHFPVHQLSSDVRNLVLKALC